MSPFRLAGLLFACVGLAPVATNAAMAPRAPIAGAEVARAAAVCSYGTHLDVSGFCVDSMDYSRRCPPGDFAISAPNGNGYRCIPAEWMREPGWLGDFFR